MAVLAGAVALAMMGPLSVSEHGFGPAPAVAQEGPAVIVTEGKIALDPPGLELHLADVYQDGSAV